MAFHHRTVQQRLVALDVQPVVLGHLVPDPDLPGTAQAPGAGGGGDLGQLGVGGVQQRQASAGPLGGQGGVAARDQAFAGVVRVGDLGEVGLVEQKCLQTGTTRPLIVPVAER